MRQQGRWPSVLKVGLLCLCLSCGPGCMSFLHPVQQSLPEVVQSCHELPQPCRDHVYIFLIHGMDPLDYANLEGLRDYLHELGFNKTYYGQLYHTWHFIKEIRRIHQEDAEARFALVGFSFGANMARNVAHSIKSDGIMIDLLLYLGGNTLENVPRDRPENAGHIANVLAHGYIWNGAQLDGAENVSVEDVWHFGSPTHPRTLELVARELAISAARVTYREPAASMRRTQDEEPAPRPRANTTAAVRDEWDFLKPMPQLRASNLPAVSPNSGPALERQDSQENTAKHPDSRTQVSTKQ